MYVCMYIRLNNATANLHVDRSARFSLCRFVILATLGMFNGLVDSLIHRTFHFNPIPVRAVCLAFRQSTMCTNLIDSNAKKREKKNNR